MPWWNGCQCLVWSNRFPFSIKAHTADHCLNVASAHRRSSKFKCGNRLVVGWARCAIHLNAVLFLISVFEFIEINQISLFFWLRRQTRNILNIVLLVQQLCHSGHLLQSHCQNQQQWSPRWWQRRPSRFRPKPIVLQSTIDQSNPPGLPSGTRISRTPSPLAQPQGARQCQ